MRQHRLLGLDGLRGVAILLVVGYHAWLRFLPGGWVGVDLFFVLSGFLITTLLLRERSVTGGVSLAHFYARRALRLLPALVLVCGAALLMTALFAPPSTTDATRVGVLASLGYSTDWLRALHLTDGGAMGHTWSLSIEEQFYMLWPPILLVLLRSRPPRSVLTVIVGAVVAVWLWRLSLQLMGADDTRLYFALDTRADCLLAGCALGVTHHLGWLQRLRGGWSLALTAGGGAYIACFAAFTSSDGLQPWQVEPVEVCAAVMLVAGVVTGPAYALRALEWRPLRLLGVISYGVYLWHHVLWTVTKPTLGSGAVELVVLLATSVVAASLSYVLLERPLIRVKQRFGPRVASPAAMGVPTMPMDIHATSPSHRSQGSGSVLTSAAST